jgi:lactate permease
LIAEVSHSSMTRSGMPTSRRSWPRPRSLQPRAVGLVGSEAAIMRTTLTYSLGLLGYVCVWTLTLSYIA